MKWPYECKIFERNSSVEHILNIGVRARKISMGYRQSGTKDRPLYIQIKRISSCVTGTDSPLWIAG